MQHVEGGTVKVNATISVVFRVEQLGETRCSAAAVCVAIQEALASVVGIDVGFVVSDYLEPSAATIAGVLDGASELAGEYIVAEGTLDEILEVELIEAPAVSEVVG